MGQNQSGAGGAGGGEKKEVRRFYISSSCFDGVITDLEFDTGEKEEVRASSASSKSWKEATETRSRRSARDPPSDHHPQRQMQAQAPEA